MLTGLLTTKAAAAIGGVALGLGATAMVVSLNLAPTATDPEQVSPAATTHGVKPKPTKTRVPGEGVGPDATGPAAHGLCTAWSRHRANGSTDALDSVPMRNLAKAAGGATKVEAYCATIGHPGKGRSQDAKDRKDRRDAKDAKDRKDRKDTQDDKGAKDRGRSGTAPNGPKPKPKPSATPNGKPSTSATPKAKPSRTTPPTGKPTPEVSPSPTPSPTATPTSTPSGP